MKRLTDDRLCEAIVNDTYIETKDLKEMKKQPSMQDLYLKLNKYEQLEQDLGCPLEVYVKATIDGIKVDGSTFKVKVRKDKYGYYFALSNGSCFPFYLKNYKKTWWLKKDKSE